MQTWTQFLEAENKETKKVVDTSKVDCITDIAKKLQEVFKHYTLNTRREAWKKITSKKGEDLVQGLLKTPGRSLSPFRTLVP